MRLRLQAKDAALSKVAKRYLAFAGVVEASSAEECETSYQALLLEISAYEFAVSKASALVDTNIRQVSEYDAMQQSVEEEM